jgi:hypothetical protein
MSGEGGGAMSVVSAPPLSDSEVVHSAYLRGCETMRVSQHHSDSALEDVERIAEKAECGRLTAFEGNSLHRGLGYLGMSRHLLRSFLMDICAQKKMDPGLSVQIGEISSLCMLCLEALATGKSNVLADGLKHLRQGELVVSRLFSRNMEDGC